MAGNIGGYIAPQGGGSTGGGGGSNQSSSGSIFTATTQEVISGVRAVGYSQSGNLQVAMASLSGRMPAIGICLSNYTSGATATVITEGFMAVTSGLGDYSGYAGQQVWVGRSGQVVSTSGSWNSGGLLSGDIWQAIGEAVQGSGGLFYASVASQPAFIVSLVYSGNIASGNVVWSNLGSGAIRSGHIASGQVGGYHLSSGAVADRAQYVSPITSGLQHQGFAVITGETISGQVAVTMSPSGFLRIAMAAVSGRMPAIGVVVDNVASGIQAQVYSQGLFQFTSGLAIVSGFNQALWVGRSGNIVALSGNFNSGGFLSGDIGQKIGTSIASGINYINVGSLMLVSGGPLGFPTTGLLA